MFPRTVDKKIGYWFGDYKTYKKCRDKYWEIFIKYNMGMKVHNMWSPGNNIIPPMTTEEYGYWYPFHMLIQEGMSSRIVPKSDETD